MPRGIPATFSELSHVFSDEAEAVNYLVTNDVLDVPLECPNCSSDLNYKYSPTKNFCVRCNRKACAAEHGRCSTSILAGTFFMNARIPINEILHFLWMFVLGSSNQAVQDSLGWATATVVDWMHFAQQLVGEVVTSNLENFQVGGPGVVVQVDESKFGKRKYHRGHRVEGVWVIGGVEETDERKCFMIKVPNRNRRTLHRLIKQFILPGSIIISDDWKAYKKLDEIPGYYYEHKVVVHEHEFVNADGDHTNMIEGTWAGVKMMTPKRKRTEACVQGCLHEFMWRRKNAGRLWQAILEALATVRHL